VYHFDDRWCMDEVLLRFNHRVGVAYDRVRLKPERAIMVLCDDRIRIKAVLQALLRIGIVMTMEIIIMIFERLHVLILMVGDEVQVFEADEMIVMTEPLRSIHERLKYVII
jgi:hypothetical protein